jgi:hypothetical protein
MNFLNSRIKDLKQLAKDKQAEYQKAEPFPSIVIDDFFNEEMLSQVLADFPDLSKKADIKMKRNLLPKANPILAIILKLLSTF